MTIGSKASNHISFPWTKKRQRTCALIKSSLLSAKKCRAIMLLRSRMHCLSPSDNPNAGSGAGRNGIPPWLLPTKECKKFDNTLWGGPAYEK